MLISESKAASNPFANRRKSSESGTSSIKPGVWIANTVLKYNKISKDEFITLMCTLRKSDKLKIGGKKIGRGKGKKKQHKKQVLTHGIIRVSEPVFSLTPQLWEFHGRVIIQFLKDHIVMPLYSFVCEGHDIPLLF